MKAVILAAGKGTRMKEITETIPKPMVLIKDKPMLEHIITFVKNAGLTEFGIVIGYKKSFVEEYFGDGSGFGISITYIEQKEQNGTGAAFHLTREFTNGDSVFFTFGDVLTPPDNYLRMKRMFEMNNCYALLGLNIINDPYRGAAVYIDEDNNIIKMVEKPPKGTSTTNLNNAGVMVFNPNIYEYTSNLKLSPRGEYELTDVFNMISEDGKVLKGYILSGYWKDIGTRYDLDEINNIFSITKP